MLIVSFYGGVVVVSDVAVTAFNPTSNLFGS